MNGWREQRGEARGEASGLRLTLKIQRWEEVADQVRTFPSPDIEQGATTLLISNTLETPEEGSRPGYLIEGTRLGRRELAAFVLPPETLADHRVTVRFMTSRISPRDFLELYHHHHRQAQTGLRDGLKAFIRHHGPRPGENPQWNQERGGQGASANLNDLRLIIRRSTRQESVGRVEDLKERSVNIRNVVESRSRFARKDDGPVLQISLLLGQRVTCMIITEGEDEIKGRKTDANDPSDVAAFTRAHTPRDILDWMVQSTLQEGTG